ncbi:DUF7144 family membrane protein [Dactylosporangium sp. CA-092794]|uniref:DUF7144 family membrane protein n=1 Tax=Dactylosporangium sp. CA-092794 TaxID=3239929 RepID=UPI003D915C1D
MLLAVLGVLNILEGLVALLQRQVAFIDGGSLVVVNVTGLGVVMIAFGALLVICGIGLLTRSPVARIAAIVVVSLHVLAQIGSLGAYPVWSLLMIALDVVILYALTVRWGDVPREIDYAPATAGGVHRADRDLQQREGAFPMNQPPRTAPPAHAAAEERPEATGRPEEEYQGQRRSEQSSGPGTGAI